MSDFVALDDPSLWQRWRSGKASPAPRASRLPTVDDLERLHDQARAEGRAEGLAEGRAAIAGQAKRLETLVTTLEQSYAASEQELVDNVLSLALELARQMLQEALPVKRELLLPVVREAMRALPGGSTPAQILLNPADVDLVRAHFGEELRIASCQVVEDHRIQPGGCRLMSPQCEIDATLGTRWKRLVATLGEDHAWLES